MIQNSSAVAKDERRRATHKVVHAVLDALGQGDRLLLARDDENYLSSVHHGCDADGESHSRNGSEVVAEEASVRKDRVVSEGLDASARDE